MAVDGNKFGNDKRVRTENALKKPQHAWIRDIDNSFNAFIPTFASKVNFIGTEPMPASILAKQRDRAAHPEEYRCLVRFGEHKKQLENEELPNPYEEEIKAFDALVKANNEAKVAALVVPDEPTPYKLLDDTPFTFVDTEESLALMKVKLEQAREIAIDLEHHS